VLVLAQHFLDYYGRKYKKGALAFTEEQKAELRGYSWPGNVRELRNVIERAVILSGGGVPELSLPVGVRAAQAEGFPDEPTLEELQRRYIRHVLEKTEGRISGPGGAAEILGLKRTTLYSRMRKLGMA
jgi:DNA-binding NtrC family response regulator